MTVLQVDVLDARPLSAHCTDEALQVRLADGRELRAPLWWYPRLLQAAPAARDNIELSPLGLHWPDLDEDISIASMLRGQKAPGAQSPEGMQ